MPIEHRVHLTSGLGEVGVVCIHCGEFLTLDEGLLVWWPPPEQDATEVLTLHLEYAHSDCEERMRTKDPRGVLTDAVKVMSPYLAKWFEDLRQLAAASAGDPDGGTD